MARKTSKQLDNICKKLGVDRLWSWSRYNAYHTDNYGYYLRYVARIQGDRNDGIYGISGNKAHDILESLYSEEIDYKDMLDEYESALMEFDLAELKYDRTDDIKNEATANKYETCLKHFFLHHEVIKSKLYLEKFIVIKVGDDYFQGYIDAFHKKNNKIVITDWKTSSIYTGAEMKGLLQQIEREYDGMESI